MLLRVETTATMAEATAELADEDGASYIVMTNREGVREAVRQVAGTRVGVMDPYGEIIKPAEEDGEKPRPGEA
jgi:hypothetical protein